MIVKGIRDLGDGKGPQVVEISVSDPDPNAPKRARPKATTLSSLDFFNQFTDAEHTAIWAAATQTPEIGAGLTRGLAVGRIDLTAAELRAWMDGLVAAGILTADRETEILTP